MRTSNFFTVLFFALATIFISSCSKSDDPSGKVSQETILEKDLTYLPKLEIKIPEDVLGVNVKAVRKTYDNTLSSNDLIPTDFGIWSIEAFLNNKYGSASFKFSEIKREVFLYDLGVTIKEDQITEEKISKAINDISIVINERFNALQLPEINKSVYYIDIKPFQDKRNHIIIKAKIAYGITNENYSTVDQLVLRDDCLSTYASKYAFGSMGACDGTPTGFTLGPSVSPWDGGQVIEKVVTNKLRLDDNYDCINSSPLPSYPPGYAYYNLDEKYLSSHSSLDYGGLNTFSNSCMVRADYITYSNQATTMVNDVIDEYFPANYHASDLDLYTLGQISGSDTYWHYGSLTTGGLIGEF